MMESYESTVDTKNNRLFRAALKFANRNVCTGKYTAQYNSM